jgi:hypothetical protein
MNVLTSTIFFFTVVLPFTATFIGPPKKVQEIPNIQHTWLNMQTLRAMKVMLQLTSVKEYAGV